MHFCQLCRMVIIILSFITSFALTYVAIPSIIHLADKNLVDEPERGEVTMRTPSLGALPYLQACSFPSLCGHPSIFW